MPINMQTEEIIALETRLKQFGADEFRAEMRVLCARLASLAEEAVHLSLALGRDYRPSIRESLRDQPPSWKRTMVQP